MFGRDVYILILASLLLPKLKYLGNKSSLLFVEMLQEAYMLAVMNLKAARDRWPMKRPDKIPNFNAVYLVLLKNHKNQTWDPKYISNLICKIIND